MKLEGDFEDSINSGGYGIHTGGSMGNDYSFYVGGDTYESDIVSDDMGNINVEVLMIISKWFHVHENQIPFILTTEGIMGDTIKQMQLKENGRVNNWHGVFRFYPK